MVFIQNPFQRIVGDLFPNRLQIPFTGVPQFTRAHVGAPLHGPVMRHSIFETKAYTHLSGLTLLYASVPGVFPFTGVP
jgi:hypothetical protein